MSYDYCIALGVSGDTMGGSLDLVMDIYSVCNTATLYHKSVPASSGYVSYFQTHISYHDWFNTSSESTSTAHKTRRL